MASLSSKVLGPGKGALDVPWIRRLGGVKNWLPRVHDSPRVRGEPCIYWPSLTIVDHRFSKKHPYTFTNLNHWCSINIHITEPSTIHHIFFHQNLPKIAPSHHFPTFPPPHHRWPGPIQRHLADLRAHGGLRQLRHGEEGLVHAVGGLPPPFRRFRRNRNGRSTLVQRWRGWRWGFRVI